MRASAYLLLACTTGCGVASESSEPAEALALPVIGGRASPESDDGVVVIRTERTTDTSVCSASLLAPNLLLTARHCLLADYPAGQIRCKADGSLDPPSDGVAGDAVSPEQVLVYTGVEPSMDGISSLPGGEPAALGARIITTTWPSVCKDDVGLVVLDRALTLPTLAFDLSKVIHKNDELAVVGYGVTETSGSQDYWSPRRRRDGLLVKYVDTLPDSFALGRSVCKGDSGGPALDARSGAIVGVYSLGFPGNDATACSSDTALNYFARISGYEALLREAFEAAEQPFPEALPGAGGAAGGAGGTPGEAPEAAGGAAIAGSPEMPEPEPPASTSNDDSGCSLTPSRSSHSPTLAVALLGCLGLFWRRRVSR